MVNSFRDKDEETPVERHRKSHQRSDVDNSPGAQHHTIGESAHQAASGLVVKKLKKQVEDLTARVAYLETRDHTH